MALLGRVGVTTALAASSAMVIASPAAATIGDTVLVSRAAGATGAAGNAFSADASVSADGRFVAFASEATDLDPADMGGGSDVFVRDLTEGTTVLVSRASTSAGGTASNGASVNPSISADGRLVAFASEANNLDPAVPDLGTAQAESDVFVRDLAGGTTVLVSRASDAAGGTPGNGRSSDPSISADGRFVAFASTAKLDPDDPDTDTTEAQSDVFVRDRTMGTTVLASRATGADGEPGAAGSFNPSISGDGRIVAFTSRAGNLDPDDLSGVSDIFVRNLTEGTTAQVSRASDSSGGEVGNATALDPAISADGRFVAFESTASNLDPADANSETDVFVRDLAGGTTVLVSRASDSAGGEIGNGDSFDPAISAQGRFVAFRSAATNLVPGDENGESDVFRRQLLPDPPTPPAPGSVTCFGELAKIVGTPGDDTLTGTPGRDVIAGLGGDDRIRGLGGADLICGGDGRDRISGGDGKDRISGGDGKDRIEGGSGRDEVEGNSGDDRLKGQRGDDEVEGNSGDDRISGGKGEDKVLGGKGHDKLSGGPGDDTVRGGKGNDRT